MTVSGAARPQSPELRHRIMGGFIGNVVEWYDFALYGYRAGIFSRRGPDRGIRNQIRRRRLPAARMWR
jgi:hypothetical protein